MVLGHAGDPGGAFRGPGRDAAGEGLEPQHVVPDELRIGQAEGDDQVGQPQSQSAITAGSGLHQEMGPFGGLGAPGIDHHAARALLQGLLQEAHLVEVGLRRVLAPQHDQLRVHQVPGRVVAVVAQGEPGGLQARGPAQVAVGGGAAPEQAPEGHAHAVQHALAAAAGVVQDALGPVAAADGLEPFRHDLQGLIPGHRPELPIRSAQERAQQAPGIRFQVAESLQTRSAGGGPVARMALQPGDPPVLHGHPQAAGAVAVPGTG